VVSAPGPGGRQRLAVLNDGGSVALFDYQVDLGAHGLAEVDLAGGRHEAAFSSTLPRIVVASHDDCAAPITVIDFADAGRLKRVATMAPGCVAPGACVAAGGEVSCLLADTGEVVVVAVDLAVPTFTRIATGASGDGVLAADAAGGRSR